MGTIKKVGKQIEGTMDELVGKMQQKQGDHVKGGLRRMKGSLKKTTASLYNLDDNREDERV